MSPLIEIAAPHEDAYCMLATWRSLVVPVMGSRPLPASSARGQARALVAFAKRTGPGKLAEVTIIGHDTPFPGPEARAEFEAAAPAVAPHYCCVSAVFEGAGFRAALVRAFVASFQLLSRARYPQRVFANIQEAAQWTFPLAKQAGMRASDAGEIEEVLHAIREKAVAAGLFQASEQLNP